MEHTGKLTFLGAESRTLKRACDISTFGPNAFSVIYKMNSFIQNKKHNIPNLNQYSEFQPLNHYQRQVSLPEPSLITRPSSNR